MIDKLGSNFKNYAPFMLRVGLAAFFLIRGFAALDGTRDLLKVGVMIVGGLAALIGFWTRWAAFALGIVAFLMIVERHGFRTITEPNFQMPFLAFMMCAALWCAGGGEYSVDLRNKRKNVE
jgi:uncharacterized membrane protein YphA (DoxX/SURF4 family)